LPLHFKAKKDFSNSVPRPLEPSIGEKKQMIHSVFFWAFRSLRFNLRKRPCACLDDDAGDTELFASNDQRNLGFVEVHTGEGGADTWMQIKIISEFGREMFSTSLILTEFGLVRGS
jgi:hypothetical protein